MKDKLLSLQWKINLWVETVILTRLTPQASPGLLFRWIFKIPVLFYRLGLWNLVGKRVLMLITTGRKTGKTRYTPLEYGYDPASDSYTVMAGWGGKTDWYRNAVANRRVRARVQQRAFEATVEPLTDAEVAEMLAMVSRVNPVANRMWSRWAGFEVDGSPESLLRAAPFFSSLRLRPLKNQ